MSWLRWLAAAVPALVGLVAYAILAQTRYSNYFIDLDGEVKLGFLILIVSLFISLIIAAWLFFHQQAEAKRQQIRFGAAEDRRLFLRRLDHELKNPLTAILAGLASVSIDNKQFDNKQFDNSHPDTLGQAHRDILRNVQNQTHRLSSVVGDLRKLADLESRPLEFAPLNLTELLEDAFAQIQSQLPPQYEKALQLRLTLPTAWPPLPKILGDEDLLFLAILNLLQNAVKFSQERGNIELSAFVDGDMALVKVADTGPGIPEPELNFVWDELYRGAQTQKVGGSGLGLTFVRAIAVRHNGTVSIISRPGEGTEVTMRLPVSSAS